jgi:hypothetical protein
MAMRVLMRRADARVSRADAGANRGLETDFVIGDAERCDLFD